MLAPIPPPRRRRRSSASTAAEAGGRGLDADLVTIAVRNTPVAGDLRLVPALTHDAHHEGLIANQLELKRPSADRDREIDAAGRDR
jgi:hypothetical protein